jgi:FeS assembly SUF system protein
MAIRSRVKKTAKSMVRGAARQVLKTLDRSSQAEEQTNSSRDFGLDRPPGGEVKLPSGSQSPDEPKQVVADASDEAKTATEAVADPEPTPNTQSSEEVVAEAVEPEVLVADAAPLNESEREEVRARIVEMIQTVHDPEIPVNIYELGLIYEIDVAVSGDVVVKMTLTSPNCPAAQSLPGEVEVKSASVEKVGSVVVDVVWDPPWEPSMMSEGAQLELNMF